MLRVLKKKVGLHIVSGLTHRNAPFLSRHRFLFGRGGMAPNALKMSTTDAQQVCKKQ